MIWVISYLLLMAITLVAIIYSHVVRDNEDLKVKNLVAFIFYSFFTILTLYALFEDDIADIVLIRGKDHRDI